MSISIPTHALGIREKQAAQLLDVGYSTLRIWRQNGRGPRHSRIGDNIVIYTPEALQEFIERHAA